MTLPSWLGPAGLVLALGVGAGWFYSAGKSAEERAELQQSIKGDESTIQALNAALDSAEKKVAHDTVVLAKWNTAYQTLHDTVLRNVHDTIAVIRFVHTADSTKASCSVLVEDCQAEQAILRKQLAAMQDERDAWKAQAPTLLQRHEPLVCGVSGVLGLVGGMVLGKKL